MSQLAADYLWVALLSAVLIFCVVAVEMNVS